MHGMYQIGELLPFVMNIPFVTGVYEASKTVRKA